MADICDEFEDVYDFFNDDATTTSTPIIEQSTYAVSQGSLPNIESRIITANNNRKSNNKKLILNQENNNKNILKKVCNKDRNYRSLPGKLEHNCSHYEENHWKSLIKSYGRKLKKKSGNKSINSSIKIKLSFNSEKSVKSNKRKSGGKKYTLEIEFNGDKNNNNNNLLQLKNNKTTQVNSKCKINDDAYKINTKEEIMNIKQIELLKNYSVINNSSLQYKKTTTIRRSEEKTEDADLQESLEPPITVLSTSQQSPAIAGLNTSVTTNDFKSEQLNKSAEISTKRKQHNFKDESVQTQFQCNAEQQDDVELLKLGLLLEILNTSEFNTYKALGIKRCDREQTNYENERSFRAFLNEIDEHGEQINEIFSSGKRKLSEKRRFPVLNERGDSKLNEDLLLKGNFESIDLEKGNYCSFDAQISGGDYETYKDPLNDKDVTMQANNSQDKRFRKAMQSVISFLVPSTTSTTMKSEQIVENVSSSVYRGLPAAAASSPPLVQQTCKPPTTTPPLSLWSKLNPFRLCFSVGDTERQQKAIKSDDRTEDMLKTLFRNEYNCTQYCTMSADEYAGYSSAESQIRMNAERSELSRTVFCKAEYNPTVNYCSVADKEALDIRNNTKNGLKSIINPYANDMYNASYFSNDFQSKYSMIKYPCDGLSYAQCPGGCNLCFPELIKPNIFKTMYYPHY